MADKDDHVSLTFAVTIIFDERVITRNIGQAFGYFVNYGYQPRVYSIGAGYRF